MSASLYAVAACKVEVVTVCGQAKTIYINKYASKCTRGIMSFELYIFIGAKVYYCTRELTCCRSTVSSLLCLASESQIHTTSNSNLL